MQVPSIAAFRVEATSSFSYVVWDPETHCAAILDSVRDYDHASGRTGHTGADKIVDSLKETSLDVQWIIDTHVHADHLSAAPYLKSKVDGC